MLATNDENAFLHVQVPAHLHEAVKRAAAREYTNASAFVRQTLARAVAKVDGEQRKIAHD